MAASNGNEQRSKVGRGQSIFPQPRRRRRRRRQIQVTKRDTNLLARGQQRKRVYKFIAAKTAVSRQAA